MTTSLEGLAESMESAGRDARDALAEIFARFPDQAAPVVESAITRWLEESRSADLALASAARSTLETAMRSLGRSGSTTDSDVLRRFEPILAEAVEGAPALRPVLERLRVGLGTPTPSDELLRSLVTDSDPDRRSTTLLQLTGREEAYHAWPPGVLGVLLALALDTEECESDHMQPNHLACRAVALLASGPRTPAVTDALSAATGDRLECMRDAGAGKGTA